MIHGTGSAEDWEERSDPVPRFPHRFCQIDFLARDFRALDPFSWLGSV
jgi:hypothetical protein